MPSGEPVAERMTGEDERVLDCLVDENCGSELERREAVEGRAHLAGHRRTRQQLDFTNMIQALDAAHYSADDPIRRAVGAFDFPNILDEHEAGYDRRA